ILGNAISYQRGRLPQLKPWAPEIVPFGVLQDTNRKQTVVVHHELSAITMHFTQRVDQFDDRISRYARCSARENVLESTKCTSLVRIKRGSVCQKTFRLLRPVPAGKGDFFLLCKLNCQFAVDPVLNVEESIIQHR